MYICVISQFYGLYNPFELVCLLCLATNFKIERKASPTIFYRCEDNGQKICLVSDRFNWKDKSCYKEDGISLHVLFFVTARAH